MNLLSFLLLLAIAYLVWRINDRIPDILFRLGELQRDVSELQSFKDANPKQADPSDNDT
ncbi:MAG: hypothetical protein VYE04_19350 [Pseudomonadota bacterium]|nr:hypothetical protein [Pseudomonadota bacterium]